MCDDVCVFECSIHIHISVSTFGLFSLCSIKELSFASRSFRIFFFLCPNVFCYFHWNFTEFHQLTTSISPFILIFSTKTKTIVQLQMNFRTIQFYLMIILLWNNMENEMNLLKNGFTVISFGANNSAHFFSLFVCVDWMASVSYVECATQRQRCVMRVRHVTYGTDEAVT